MIETTGSMEVLSEELRDLVDRYNHNQIEFEEYRALRKVVLDRMDEMCNGTGFLKTRPLSVPLQENDRN